MRKTIITMKKKFLKYSPQTKCLCLKKRFDTPDYEKSYILLSRFICVTSLLKIYVFSHRNILILQYIHIHLQKIIFNSNDLELHFLIQNTLIYPHPNPRE